ncbi:MAG: 4Fe-4S dicluster domain-containing protein [Desulfohalobiaceae bacterium]
MKIMKATHMERCIGCYTCSLACARAVHKSLSWKRSGIRIHTSGGISTGFEAIVCLACDPAPCVAACPTGAMRQRKGGGTVYKRSLCIKCGECATACPVDAILMDQETGEPVVCIHCGRCVPLCPHDCLEMVPAPHEVTVEEADHD